MRHQGDATGAEPLLRECLRIRLETVPEHAGSIAGTRHNLGACLIPLGQYDEAESLLLAALPMIRATRGKSHRDTLAAFTHLADLYIAWGKPEEAETYRTLLARAERPDSPDTEDP